MTDSTQDNLGQKASWFMDKIIDNIEDIANSGEDATLKERSGYVSVLAGISLATALQHQGWFQFFRIIWGAIVIRFKHPSLAEI